MPRRFCETNEVASAICFLLSQLASYITSTDLLLDGGYTSMTVEQFGEKITLILLEHITVLTVNTI